MVSETFPYAGDAHRLAVITARQSALEQPLAALDDAERPAPGGRRPQPPAGRRLKESKRLFARHRPILRRLLADEQR